MRQWQMAPRKAQFGEHFLSLRLESCTFASRSATTLLSRVLAIPADTPTILTDVSGLPLSCQKNVGWYFELDHDVFLPYSILWPRHSSRHPTAAAWVRARVWSCGICGGHSDAGASFLRVLRFLLPIFIPPNSPCSQSPKAGTVGQ
jgi:hypothetical protein